MVCKHVCRQIMGKSLSVKAAVGTANVIRCSQEEQKGNISDEWWQRTSSLTCSSCEDPPPLTPHPSSRSIL